MRRHLQHRRIESRRGNRTRRLSRTRGLRRRRHHALFVHKIDVHIAKPQLVPRPDFLLRHARIIHKRTVGTLQIQQKIPSVLKDDLGMKTRQRLGRYHHEIPGIPTNRHLRLLRVHIDINGLIILISIDDSCHGDLSKKIPHTLF